MVRLSRVPSPLLPQARGLSAVTRGPPGQPLRAGSAGQGPRTASARTRGSWPGRGEAGYSVPRQRGSPPPCWAPPEPPPAAPCPLPAPLHAPPYLQGPLPPAHFFKQKPTFGGNRRAHRPQIMGGSPTAAPPGRHEPPPPPAPTRSQDRLGPRCLRLCPALVLRGPIPVPRRLSTGGSRNPGSHRLLQNRSSEESEVTGVTRGLAPDP